MTLFRYSLELPGLPALQGKRHWRAVTQERKTWSDRVEWALRDNRYRLPASPLTHARLRFTRCSASEPDGDNLAHSFKAIRDGLVRAGVIADDKPAVVGIPEYCWEKASPRGGCVRIEVWELEPGKRACPTCGHSS